MVGSSAFRCGSDGQNPLVSVKYRETAPSGGHLRMRDFWRRLCCPFSDQAIAEKRCGSHRGIYKSARKCRFIYWVARKICSPNISCSAVASHCRADSDGKIDRAVSGAEV